MSTHNGLIGMLERGEIDIALSDFALTSSRTQVAKSNILGVDNTL